MMTTTSAMMIGMARPRPGNRGRRGVGTRNVTSGTYAVSGRKPQCELTSLARRGVHGQLEPESLDHPADETQTESQTTDTARLRGVGLGEVAHEFRGALRVESRAGVLHRDPNRTPRVVG